VNSNNLFRPTAQGRGKEDMDASENFFILEYTFTESLQVTPRGKFCLVRIGDIPYEGEEIKEVTRSQARAWLRKHDPQGKYSAWQDPVRVVEDWAKEKGGD